MRLGYDKIKDPQSKLQQVHDPWRSHEKLSCCVKTRAKELLSVINSTFEQHSCDKEPSGKCKSQLMRFTMVNFVYLFYTIVKGFYLGKLLSVTSTNVWFF